MEAIEKARASLVRVTANMSLGAYDIAVAIGQVAEPTWPDLSFKNDRHTTPVSAIGATMMATITDNPATDGTGDGRMSDGRFAPGNKLSRGNPIHRKMHIMRRALLEAADTHSVKYIFRKRY
jgi:hypothetical protein